MRKHTAAAPSATGAPSTASTPPLVATTTSAAPTSAGMAYSPLLSTLGNLPDQHVPQRAAAHRGDRPEDDRLRRPDAQLERLARAGDREQAQPRGVQHVDRAGEPPSRG